MANKLASISIGAVNERRLRPVYEHLDNGNHKSALHEAEKVLKKQKDLSAAKVLKTIALHRLGRGDEAYSLSQEVAHIGPVDENSLQGLSLYYREIQRSDLIPPIYEKALSKCPGNEEYLTHLFMSFVRTERLKDMQRVAISLYKHHPKNPYLFWGIMAIVMQAEDDKQLGKTMFLPLAERMIEKHIKKGKLEAEAETRLYLMVLDMLGKHEKALSVLEEEKSKTFSMDSEGLHELGAEFYRKMGKWDKVNSASKELFKKDPDIWNHTLSYLNSLECLVEKGWKPEDSKDAGTSSDNPDYTWDQAVDLFLKIKGKDLAERPSKCRRGPFLAVLELRKRMEIALQKDPSITMSFEKLGSEIDLILEYSELFATKPCCFIDLEPYTKLFSEEQRTKLLNGITEELSKFHSHENEVQSEVDDRTEEKKISQHLFYLKMQRYLGYHDSLEREEKLKVIEDLLQRHQKGLKASAYRPETDVRVVDDYCLLAANMLIDLWQDEGNAEDLWRAIYVLEIGKKCSIVNYKFKIMLVRLFSTVGIFLPCAQIYDSLDIKHMQQDTLGYIISHSVSSLGHYQLASQAFEAARAFFISNEKDSVEFLISCFRNGTFHKVSEFISFRDQVKNSFHSASTINEHTYMDFITQADIDVPFYDLMLSSCLPKEMSDLDKLTDNRDFSMKFDWAPETRQLRDSEIKISFSLEKKWLRFREIQIRAVITLLKLMTPPPALQEQIKFDEINLLLDQLEKIIKETKEDENLDIKFPFHGPPQPKIKPSLDIGYQDLTLKLLRIAKKILMETSNPGSENELKETLESFISGIEDALLSTGLLANDSNTEYIDGSTVKEKSKKQDGDKTITCETSLPEESTPAALSLPVPDALKNLQRNHLERLVSTCELFSLCVLLIYNLKPRIKPESMKRRKKKKGKQGSGHPAVAEFYLKFVNDMKQVGRKVKAAVMELGSRAEVMTLDLSKSELEPKKNLSNGDIKPMQDGEVDATPTKDTPTEESPATEPEPTSSDTPTSKVAPLPDQLVRIASASVLSASTQILRVVEGRLENLKTIRI